MSGDKLALAAVAALAVLSRARGSRALVDEGRVDGHWGSQGVGLLLTTGTHILLMLRSPYVDDPGVWGVPGGAVRVDSSTGEAEELLQAAAKELEEEAGLRLPVSYLRERMTGVTVYRSGRFRFTTYVVQVPSSMMRRKLTTNWESVEASWVTEGDLSYIDLHHGVEYTLETLDMEHPDAVWS